MVCIGSRKKSDDPTDRHLNPIKVLHEVEDIMADDSIIVADGGDFVGTAAYILRYWFDRAYHPGGHYWGY